MNIWAHWYECHCNKCKAVNFVNNGDPEDLTGVDVEGFKCWACGEPHFFLEEEDRPDYADIDFLGVGIRMEEIKP